MRTPPIPAFQAAPEEPILRAFEAQSAPQTFPGEVLRLLPAGREAVTPRVEYYYRQLKALPRRVRRALASRYARSLAGVALLLALGQLPALAATITVGGACTLVDAITAANTDLATGGCPAGSGADVIALNGNVTLSAVNNTTDGPNGLPSVTSPLTINGGGHTLRRSTVTGTPDFRLLHVADTGNLTFNRITLTNGRVGSPPYYGGGGVVNAGTLTLTNSTVSGNSVDGFGGGLLNYAYSSLTLTGSTVSGNTANHGGGLCNYNNGTLTLTDSTVSGNRAASGGGLSNLPSNYRYGGTVTVTNSTVSGNSAQHIGGGLYNRSGGTVTLTGITISGNRADDFGGGGVFNGGGTVTITDSTVYRNSTRYSGGGIAMIFGTLDLANSTVSGNRAKVGGGLYNNVGTLTVTNSTVSGNSASFMGGGLNNFGTVTLTRTLVSGNRATSEREILGGHDITANNFNLFGTNGDSGGFPPGPTDIVPAPGVMLADILEPLADNGGPTQTHALVAGSPALDASPIDKHCAATDQRGAFRPQGTACDIGAFEVGVEPDPFALPTPTTGCTVNGVPGQLCVGTAGPDRIIGTTGNDVILGLTGDDHLDGSRGDDRLFGGEDNDRLIGGNGDDQLFGQTGDDDLRGLVGNDLLEGGDGNDRLKGHEGNDQLRGGNGNDALRGLEGQDTLEGGAGSDLLRGAGGADTLNGGPGADRLVGGGGTDRCTSDAEDNIVVLCE